MGSLAHQSRVRLVPRGGSCCCSQGRRRNDGSEFYCRLLCLLPTATAFVSNLARREQLWCTRILHACTCFTRNKTVRLRRAPGRRGAAARQPPGGGYEVLQLHAAAHTLNRKFATTNSAVVLRYIYELVYYTQGLSVTPLPATWKEQRIYTDK